MEEEEEGREEAPSLQLLGPATCSEETTTFKVSKSGCVSTEPSVIVSRVKS